jgi:hypothetical protein
MLNYVCVPFLSQGEAAVSKKNLQVEISKASLVKEVLGELAQTNICAFWCAHTWKNTKTLYNLVLIL